MSESTKQLVSESDRDILRKYLTTRLKQLKRGLNRAGEQAEAAYWEGGQLEIVCAFDELLGEEPPDLRKKPRGH